MSDHPAVLKYANSFARTANIEREDALQEARLALHKAMRAKEDGRYDPHLASFDTYATHSIYRHMCGIVNPSKKRIETVPLEVGRDCESLDGPTSQELEDKNTPLADRRKLLADLVLDLPEDAYAIVEMVLSDTLPDELVDAVLSGAKGSSEKLLRYIRRSLGLRRGDRAHAAFAAVQEMLAAMAT